MLSSCFHTDVLAKFKTLMLIVLYVAMNLVSWCLGELRICFPDNMEAKLDRKLS